MKAEKVFPFRVLQTLTALTPVRQAFQISITSASATRRNKESMASALSSFSWGGITLIEFCFGVGWGRPENE